MDKDRIYEIINIHFLFIYSSILINHICTYVPWFFFNGKQSRNVDYWQIQYVVDKIYLYEQFQKFSKK